MKCKLPFEQADHLAGELIERLRPHCQRIEKAGSLRRRKALIGDIDFVIIPKFLPEMFGGESTDHELNAIDWGTWGRVLANGPKYKKILLPQGLNLELSIVTPPAQWAVIFMIRTHCAEHSQRHGFCFACGEFWGGTESFDFGPGYCSNCASEFEEEEYDDPHWEYEI